MNDDDLKHDEKLLAKFRKELQDDVGRRLLSGPITKEHVTEALTKQMQEMGLSPEPVNAPTSQVLWDTFSLSDRFFWRLFRHWPFKRIAEETRNAIDRLNAEVRGLEAVIQESTESFENAGHVGYPKVFQPHPKQVLLVTMRAPASIQSVSVVVTIPGDDVDKGESVV